MMKKYTKYVKKGLENKFAEMCKMNSLDFYSCGCVLTAHLVMEKLMQHAEKGVFHYEKVNPKEAWEHAMRQTPYHSGMSAAMTATIIARYSPRGEEFKEWCIKDEVVMVNWGDSK
jgi:hypothetical protein